MSLSQPDGVLVTCAGDLLGWHRSSRRRSRRRTESVTAAARARVGSGFRCGTVRRLAARRPRSEAARDADGDRMRTERMGLVRLASARRARPLLSFRYQAQRLSNRPEFQEMNRPRAVVLDKAGATTYDPGTKVLMAGTSENDKEAKWCRQNRTSLRRNSSGPGTAL
jgi:hypothetical protein